MHKAQAVADLTLRLARVTTTEHARTALERALRSTGLTHAMTIRDTDLEALLQALAAEGGAIQSIAEQIAMHSDGDGPLAA